ncbi:hypothetical protein Egran_02317 [Elaphomyces granulatus]|uniref:C2H2-type domain-containing protein n=1 Tax=Elaphomyces granulatus TaxID=519963 RepID=A0A232M0I7_9EURO|nr:hypothetical protein Egran_02317 [Elaphomyces granulatus]
MASGDQDTAVFDIAYECLSEFDKVYHSHGRDLTTRLFEMDDLSGGYSCHIVRKCDFMGLRNSFIFWADYTGALSLMESSLDARLQGFPDISSMFVELLEMISRNLSRLLIVSPSAVKSESDAPTSDGASSNTSRIWEDALRAIDYALDRLHFLGGAIRKASAKRLEYNVTSYLTEEDFLFRKYAAAIVKRNFPQARSSLHKQLGDTIAVRRKFMLRKRSHATNLTVRRDPHARKSPERLSVDDPSKPEVSGHRRAMRASGEPQSAVTKASKPNRQTPAFKKIFMPSTPILRSMISSMSSVHDDSIEYPECPQVKDNEKHVQCSYCLKALSAAQLRGPEKDNYWRSHLKEDLQPYVCLFPECVEALVFFTHQKEWICHMEASHSTDWPRKVHNIMWYCNMDHEPVEQFQSEVEWRTHMQDPYAHPNRRSKPPTDVQLAALSTRKQQRVVRDQYVCPLCENIPEKIQPFMKRGNGSDLANMLNEHIAKHMISLSLISLPWIDGGDADTEGKSIDFDESFKRLLNPRSEPLTPSQPSEIDRLSVDCPWLLHVHVGNWPPPQRSWTGHFLEKTS